MADLKGFSKWLSERGAVMIAPTNEWEVIRFESDQGIGIVYKSGKGRLTFSGDAKRAFEHFEAKRQIPLAPVGGRRGRKKREMIEFIAQRDGWGCFYCEEALSVETATREHLVPVAHGGSDHVGNIVLGCEPCNKRMGDLALVEKLRIRDKMKAERRG